MWCLLGVSAYATVQECYSIGHVSVHTQFTSSAVTLTGHDWLNQDHLQEKAFLKETIIQKIQLMKNLQKTESLTN